MANQTITKPRQRRFNAGRLAIYLILIVIAFFYILPVYLIIITGLKQYNSNLYAMWDLPPILSLEDCTNPYFFCFDGFYAAWFGSEAVIGMGQAFTNSVIMAVPATIISTALGSLKGYILSKWKFKYADVIFPFVLFGMFIPYQSILIPLTLTLRSMGLYASLPGLIFVHVVYSIPIAALIFRNYYTTIPNEMLEAARIDGGNIFSIYRHIILPLSPPAIVVVLIWQFTNIWNDFLFALMLTSPKTKTMPLGILASFSASEINWGIMAVMSVFAIIPAVIIAIFLNRYFVQGLTMGAAKG